MTNKIYVPNLSDNTVTVIDGATNTTSTVNVGTSPYAVAVNSVTNKIYVTNVDSSNVTVIDGATNATTTVNVGIYPYCVAVNPITNKAYVTSYGDNTITVIDGATNSTVTLSESQYPYAQNPYTVVVNPVNNQIYVANEGTDGLAVFYDLTTIDGATNTLTTSQNGSFYPGNVHGMAINPSNNALYIALGDPDNTVAVGKSTVQQTIPINTVITPPASDPLALPPSPTGVYETANPAPQFTAQIFSQFTASSTYSGKTGVVNPPPTELYYQLDTQTGPWQPAGVISPVNSNPGSFTIPLANVQPGLHTLFVYATYGNQGTPHSAANGSGNSPEIGNITPYTFLKGTP